MKKLFSNTIIAVVFIHFFLFFNKEPANAQIVFQHTIGGTTGYEAGHSIIRTIDRGYIVGGFTTSFAVGHEDAYIIKLDSTGNLQWTRTVGGSNYDYAWTIIQTIDGGYATAGSTNSFADGYNAYVIKLDIVGNLQWTRTIGGNNNDNGKSIIQTTDSGYVIAGDTKSFGAGLEDVYIVKLDVNGNLQWTRTVGGSNDDAGFSIVKTADSGFAVAGYTKSFGAGNYDAYVVKLDANGNLQWTRTVGGSGLEWAISIIQSSDGGYAVSGTTWSFGTFFSFYIFKLDSSGNLQWTKAVGGSGQEEGYTIIQTIDGGYAITGWTTSFGDIKGDTYIVKLDSNGNLQWDRAIINPNIFDYGFSLVQTTYGGFVIAGATRWDIGTQVFGDIYIIKTDSNGNTCGNISSGGTSSSGGIMGSGGTTSSGGVTSSGGISGSGGTLTVLCSNIGIKKLANEIPHAFVLYQNYPNPFNPTTKIKFDIPLSPLNERRDKGGFVTLVIYDLLAREVATLVNDKLQPGTYEVEWDGSNYPSGVYFYILTAEDYTETKKLVLLK